MERSRGLIDPKAERFAQENRRPLTHHLDGIERELPDGRIVREFVGFRHALTDKGREPRYVNNTRTHIARIIEACKAEYISDLTASAVQSAIGCARRAGVCGRATPI